MRPQPALLFSQLVRLPDVISFPFLSEEIEMHSQTYSPKLTCTCRLILVIG